MKNIAIVGSFFGDESKGNFTHHFSPYFHYVVRTSGGNNCGHTIYRDGKKFVHHLVPSINFSSDANGFLGAGMVINPDALLEELLLLEKDIPGVSHKITVDPDAFAVLPKHIDEDKAKNGDLGSTNRGIGPAYTEKISRRGTKIRDLIKDNHTSIVALKKMGVKFRYVLEMYDEFSKSPLLFEGAQSILLDPNFGTYPYVTSGDCSINSIFNSGFGFAMPKEVYGVLKVYGTRVGEGPFPTELFGKEANDLRVMGSEFGATTGRPRRVGWLDLPALKYVVNKSNITNLIISKFDILTGMKSIKMCNRYEKYPVSGADFFNAAPSYIDVPGWQDHKQIDQLMPFIKTIEEYTNRPVSYISHGVSPKDIVALKLGIFE